MIYHDLVKDFARRTRDNLDRLHASYHEGEEVYEVTALINSLLGLLVFPQQKYVASIPERTIQELEADGWPIPQVVGHFPQVPNLQQLVRYLRNAVSHFNVEFVPNDRNEIAGLIVWNVNPRNGRTTWKAKLSITELEGIARRFIALVLAEPYVAPGPPRDAA